MNSYMVVATFKEGVTPADIRALIPAEQAQAKVAMPKRTVFIEAFGEDDASVLSAIQSLPFFAIWNVELFPTSPPAGANF